MAVVQVTLGYPAATNEYINTACNNTVSTIKATAGAMYMIVVDNTANAAAASFVKFYDSNGAVTVGTTIPDWVFKIPGAAYIPIFFANPGTVGVTGGCVFTSGLQVACVTAGGTAGTTSPTSSVPVSVIYN